LTLLANEIRCRNKQTGQDALRRPRTDLLLAALIPLGTIPYYR
jgi:hypothetical protein